MYNNIKVVTSSSTSSHRAGKFNDYFAAVENIEVGQAIEIPQELCTASIRQQMFQTIGRRGLKGKVSFTMKASEGPRLNKLA